MGAQTTPRTDWTETLQGDCRNGKRDTEAILRNLTDCFAQANIAADFLLMQEEPEESSPGLQLVCIIKERMAAIQEHVTELYLALDKDDTPVTLC